MGWPRRSARWVPKQRRQALPYDSLAILRAQHFSVDAAVVSSLVDAVASTPSSTSPRVRERVAEMRAPARGLANRTAARRAAAVYSPPTACARRQQRRGRGAAEQQRPPSGRGNSGEAMPAEAQPMPLIFKHGTGGARPTMEAAVHELARLGPPPARGRPTLRTRALASKALLVASRPAEKTPSRRPRSMWSPRALNCSRHSCRSSRAACGSTRPRS